MVLDRNLDSPVPAPRGRVERRRGSPASTASTTARYYQSLLCDQYWWNKFFVTLPENFPQCFCRCQAQYISDTSGESRSLPYLHLRRQQRNNETKILTLFNTLFTTKQIIKHIWKKCVDWSKSENKGWKGERVKWGSGDPSKWERKAMGESVLNSERCSKDHVYRSWWHFLGCITTQQSQPT